jgi:hypothetical protein
MQGAFHLTKNLWENDSLLYFNNKGEGFQKTNYDGTPEWLVQVYEGLFN